jgi:tetratricopeptide (TPR) repeat protein
VIEFINHPDDAVVVQTVKALGRLAPTPDQANALLPLLIGDRVRDEAIRSEAWQVFESILPSMSGEQLTNWAEKFRGDPSRQIAIRRRLVEVLTRDKDLDKLATTQSQIARNYMELKQFDAAVPYFRAALEYRQGNREAGAQVEELIDGYMHATLRSNAFNEAIAFAQQTLKEDVGKQALIGSIIRSRVEDLGQSASMDDLKRAAELIKQARSMEPPLGERYLSDLNDLQKQIEQRLAQNQGSMTPRPADGIASPATTSPAPALAGNEGN